MAKNKTTETRASVAGFLATVKDKKKRSDCSAIVELISKETGLEPKLWGSAIVGFGSYHYVYESGREGDAPLAAFSPRANAIVLYLSSEFDQREDLLKKFGKHKTGKGCIYIQNLEDIDTSVLGKMVKKTIEHRKKLHPGC